MPRGGARPGAGQPRKEINLTTLRALAKIGATWTEIAAVMGCSDQTIMDRRKVDPELDRVFTEGKAEGTTTLRRLQWQGAQEGNPTMLIWLGKQLLGQRDNLDQSIKSATKLTVESGVQRADDAGRDSQG